MAPKQNKKRKTTQGASSSSGRFDSFRFLSRETQDLFEATTKKRGVIKERGITMDREIYPEICEEIERREWVEFVTNPPPAAISLVREFYANATHNTQKTSWVRGVQIKYDEATIARVLKVPLEHDEVYDGAEDHNIDEIARVVCEKSVTWKIAYGVKVWFYARELPTPMRVWLHFICARIIPTVHLNEVSKDRLYILHAFVMRKGINLASHIRVNIENAANNSGVGLCFPHVITQLIIDAGVDVSGVEFVKSRKPISFATVQRMMRLAGEQPPEKSQPPAQSDNEASQSHHSAAPPDPPQPTVRVEELLNQAVENMTQRLDSMEQQMNTRLHGLVNQQQRMEGRMEQLFTYMDGQFRVMDVFLRSMANAARFNVQQFPHRPSVPLFPKAEQSTVPPNSGRFPEDPPSPSPDIQPFQPSRRNA